MDLSKGLYIENHKFLIPWEIFEDEAWEIGNPAPTSSSNDRTRITWKNVVCLNGFKCDVCVWFERSKLYKFLVVHPNLAENDGQILEMVIHGDRVFGKRKSDDYFWSVDGIEITIHCDERFVAAYWYEIANSFIR